MTQQPTLTLLHGDNRDVMRGMAEHSVHSVITSPPYWQKRKYNDPPVVYGVGTEREWSGELGWEPTPQMFVAHLVEVFAEVWRVLRDDGLLFVNLMDTRVGGGAAHDDASKKQKSNGGTLGMPSVKANGLRAKDMALVPQRFVIAMQDAGWYVRSVIVWAKGESFNPYRAGSTMPESARDRPTDSYETIFMFSKRPRYYSDMAAVAEASTMLPSGNVKPQKGAGEPGMEIRGGLFAAQQKIYPTRNLRSVWTVPAVLATPPPAKIDGDVWRINTKGTDIPHYATWAPELAATMIKMSTSEVGACSVCGAPWERVQEKTKNVKQSDRVADRRAKPKGDDERATAPNYTLVEQYRTIGWRPTCDCSQLAANATADAPTVPCTVLDPFGGSGTTGRAAYALGRNSICIELKQEYHALAEEHRPDQVALAPVPEAQVQDSQSRLF